MKYVKHNSALDIKDTKAEKTVIHRMGKVDFDQIAEDISSFDPHASKTALASKIDHPDYLFFVVKLDNIITGYLLLWLSFEEIHITDIAVKKDYRNHGIGSTLLEEAISITKNKHFPSLTLEVRNTNIVAQKLYQKYHFRQVGIRKNYYENEEDAIIMTLHLGGTDEKI